MSRPGTWPSHRRRRKGTKPHTAPATPEPSPSKPEPSPSKPAANCVRSGQTH